MTFWEDEEIRWKTKLRAEKDQCKMVKLMHYIVLLCVLLISVGVLYSATT